MSEINFSEVIENFCLCFTVAENLENFLFSFCFVLFYWFFVCLFGLFGDFFPFCLFSFTPYGSTISNVD